jgi:hypothetical protein
LWKIKKSNGIYIKRERREEKIEIDILRMLSEKISKSLERKKFLFTFLDIILGKFCTSFIIVWK